MLRAISAIATLLTLKPNENLDDYLPEIASLELVQSFSLIHDDLPALDNASLRRGVESVHKKFGEPAALLAGDELLCLAFRSIALGRVGTERKTILLEELTSAISQVIQGQSLELELTGKKPSLSQVELVMRLKTASLISCSLLFGGILAEADEESLSLIRKVGIAAGIAYQVKDDLISVTGKEEEVGKSLSADDILGRPTIVSVLGYEAAENYFQTKMNQAREALKQLAGEVSLLSQLLDILEQRVR